MLSVYGNIPRLLQAFILYPFNVVDTPSIMKENTLLTLMKAHIKTFPKVLPQYKYENEDSINPVYSDIEHCSPLCIGEKRIWVLRTDFTLALGIKNAYASKGNLKLLDKVDETMHTYVNLDDRYGHPSLALPENDYDGSVYYAGWLHQRSNQLEIFICSGRYHNENLSRKQRLCLELYLFLVIKQAFGNQPIIFIDWHHEKELELFLKGSLFHPKIPKRTYSSQIKVEMLSLMMLFLFASLTTTQYHALYSSAKNAILSTLFERLDTILHMTITFVLRLMVSMLINSDVKQPTITQKDNHTSTHKCITTPFTAQCLVNRSIFGKMQPRHDDKLDDIYPVIYQQ